MYAALQGHSAVVDVLLKAGASVDEKSSSENTALICAAVHFEETFCCCINQKVHVD
jgi:ankyrin repeat protein